jgi:hypothetical protein
MTIRRYGDRPGWWIAPDTDPAGTTKRLAGLIALCVAIAGLSLPVVALCAPRPAGTAWGLAPAAPMGTYPRPDAYCAARVQHYPERVAANATANATIPPAGTDFRWGPWVNQTPEMAYNFSRVDGNFSGTTDEILEWAACKWGMDQNIAKAEATAESSWQQSTVGDDGDSYGILQVRAVPAGSPASANNGWGGYPWTQKSTALNADAQMAYLRAVYDGQSYMGNGGNGSPALKGNIWNAVSTWQSGSDTGPDWYTQQIRGYLASQAWQRSYPLPSATLTAICVHPGVTPASGIDTVPHLPAVSLTRSISAPSAPTSTHHGTAIFSQLPPAYCDWAGRNRAGQPATGGVAITRPRPARHARLRKRVLSEPATNGQLCLATCTDPASTIAHDNANSTNKTRSTSRIAAPSRGPGQTGPLERHAASSIKHAAPSRDNTTRR